MQGVSKAFPKAKRLSTFWFASVDFSLLVLLAVAVDAVAHHAIDTQFVNSINQASNHHDEARPRTQQLPARQRSSSQDEGGSGISCQGT